MKLFAPIDYWKSESEFISNGCGGGFTAFFIPDSLLGVDITQACQIHDWMYMDGKTIEDKAEADRVFLNNMIRIIVAKSYSKLIKIIRLILAKIYYDAVVVFGGPFFWAGKNQEDELGEIK